MSKTPGQINYEGAKPFIAGAPFEWDDPRFDLDAKVKWEAAASAVIEACAERLKRMTEASDKMGRHDYSAAYAAGAFAIRAMKVTPDHEDAGGK